MRAPRLLPALLLTAALHGAASAAPLMDQRYGPDAAQIADVYLPATLTPAPAPVLVIVHGGSWKNGDKAAPEVVQNKL
ncbi:MAG: alpha/beta hydrolase, partial [Achromobacter pestifer]